jgi:Winged helix-turn helix
LAREIRAMPSAVRLREDDSAEALRTLARRSKDANQSRRLLSLAAIRDGMDRGAAVKIGGMDRQTLRDWVHRFNVSGLEGLIDNWTDGPKLVFGGATGSAGADRRGRPGSREGRRRTLAADRPQARYRREVLGRLSSPLCREAFGELGFSHISARPRHPAQDERIVAAFKNVWPAPSARGLPRSASDQSASTYPASKGLLPAMMEIRALRSS